MKKIIKFFFSKIYPFPDNCCIVIIQGGLGNQIFQFLLGEELKKSFKKKVYYYDLRKSFNIYHDSNIEKLFDLKIRNCFIKINSFIEKIILSLKFLSINKILFLKFGLTLLPNLYIDDINKPIELKNISFSKSFNIFYGTWHNQINKYTNKDIFSALKFRKDIFVEEGYDFKKDFIALHVRRGDYISSSKTSLFHGNLNMNYFLKSVEKLRSKFGDLPVYIFSDDIIWVKQNIKFFIPNSFVVSSNKNSPESDLFLMSKAKYFIISNSTFSWFSAFLSTKKNKYIIIPKYWFRNMKTNSDYIFKEWDYEII